MDDERFWTLVEAAWAPLGPEVEAARRVLATRDPEAAPEPYDLPEFSVIDKALGAFVANLERSARDLASDELTDLDRVLERKLYDIDRADVQEATDGSDDGFLYARGFIVALGRDFYSAVAADPRMAVLDAECERMCYLFAHLHHERFGTFPDTGSGISRESCTNQAGWAV